MEKSVAALPLGTAPGEALHAATHGPAHRWAQLVMGIICMAMIANLQYGWTLFVNPIADKYHWTRAAIQVAFTIFVLTETWLVPIEGYLVDKYGPRIVVMGGGLLSGLGWVVNAYADTLTLLYVGAAIGGIGAGAVYGTCVGNALKWFPDRRGLAAGLTAAASAPAPPHRGAHLRPTSTTTATKRPSCTSASARARSSSCCLVPARAPGAQEVGTAGTARVQQTRRTTPPAR
jgi:hypothetical protein